MIPFLSVRAESENDPTLRSRLQRDPAEQGAVLRWVCDGAAEYLANGLPNDPAEVRAATAEYLSQADVVSEFVSERVVVAPGVSIPQKDVGVAWREWCETSGIHHPMRPADLYTVLDQEHGLRRGRSNGVRLFRDVSLGECR